jgi:thymidine kinase
MREGMPTQRGRVEVIAGPMFAGKTEELLRRGGGR